MNQTLRVSLISLVGCLGISAFLMSSSFAQVNGPGPSPSSAFDTVINLPADEAVISSAGGESVGGVAMLPIPTTQLNVNDGGAIGIDFQANFFSEVNIRGGTVGAAFRADPASEVNIIGGIVGFNFFANTNSVVNISGGTIGTGFFANTGSEVNISGGTFGNGFTASTGSEINVSGGTFGNGFTVDPGAEVNLFGSEFQIDGVELDDLLPGDAFTITDRNVRLSGLLADGEQFRFNLNSDETWTVTLAVPEPSSCAFITLVVGFGFARRRRGSWA